MASLTPLANAGMYDGMTNLRAYYYARYYYALPVMGRSWRRVRG